MDTIKEKKMPAFQRLKVRLYKHTHECDMKGEEYYYNPPTQGMVMFPVVPVCVQANVELELVTDNYYPGWDNKDA